MKNYIIQFFNQQEISQIFITVLIFLSGFLIGFLIVSLMNFNKNRKLRKDAINYMASNTEKIVNVISADGTFDITKDNFTPTDEFIKKLQAVFNS